MLHFVYNICTVKTGGFSKLVYTANYSKRVVVACPDSEFSTAFSYMYIRVIQNKQNEKCIALQGLFLLPKNVFTLSHFFLSAKSCAFWQRAIWDQFRSNPMKTWFYMNCLVFSYFLFVSIKRILLNKSYKISFSSDLIKIGLKLLVV